MQINRYGEKTAESKLNKLREIMFTLKVLKYVSRAYRQIRNVLHTSKSTNTEMKLMNIVIINMAFYLIIFLLNTSQMCLFSRHVNPANESRLGEIRQH